ncbi:MAG: cell wall hydrolase [Rhizorhabdus sp.]
MIGNTALGGCQQLGREQVERVSWLRQQLWRLRSDQVGIVVFVCIVLCSIPALVWAAALHQDDVRLPMQAAVEGPLPIHVPSVDPPPLEFLPVSTDTALAFNATVPFAKTGAAARPFLFSGTNSDYEQAAACLAAAVLYEAGDDRIGQQAVAQVVLNRVRHPSYPKTLCGVVFQGSERATGCQFTFTCDGALRRKMPAGAWTRAGGVAASALSGAVFAQVGLATHYHTNWVVPKWSSNLDKIAQVGTHLFFKFRGSPGSPKAFVGVRRGTETPRGGIGRDLDGTDPAAEPGATLADTGPVVADLPGVSNTQAPSLPIGVPATDLRGATIRLADAAGTSFVLSVPGSGFSGSHALAAHDLCKDRSPCSVAGYGVNDAIPEHLPLKPADIRRAAFFYDGKAQRGYWDCGRTPRQNPRDCIPGTGQSTAARAVAGPSAG